MLDFRFEIRDAKFEIRGAGFENLYDNEFEYLKRMIKIRRFRIEIQFNSKLLE